MRTSYYTVHVKDGRSEIEIDDSLAQRIIYLKVFDLIGDVVDDAGCDWYTDSMGRTYIAADRDWQVSQDMRVATLVDAANILSYGKTMKMEDVEITKES